MPYILAIVIVGVAVVFGTFTGVWGGLIWLVAAGIVLVALFVGRARAVKVDHAKTGPTGATRAGPGAAGGTANERVGQG